MPNTVWSASEGTRQRCTKCGEWKSQGESFHYVPSSGRYASWCKDCKRNHRTSAPATGLFGVEIEFLGNPYAVEAAMQAEGLTCNRMVYNHRTLRNAWKIVPDGSVGGGAELVSPPLRGAEGRRQVEAASRALIAAGARINRSTGLHVHHDARRIGLEAFKTLVTNWASSQAAIDEMVAPSRRNGRNQYCRPFTTYELERVSTLQTMARVAARRHLNGDRYKNLNLQSYGKYGTVEVRQHQGTVEARKIMAWIEFGQAMIKAARAGVRLEHSRAADLLAALSGGGFLAAATARYLTNRANRLAGVTA